MSTKSAINAPPALNATLEHHLATPGPSGAAAGPPDAPSGANLALARSHSHTGTHMLPARPPRGSHIGHRARSVCTTHASDDAIGGTAHTGHLRERATGGTTPSGRPAALRGRPERHRRLAAATLWRPCGLRVRGERHTISRGRPGREARAACEQ